MADLIRVAELCAGYGGLLLSLREAGWPVGLAWYAENDPDAARAMAHHHPDAPNLGDITTTDWGAAGPVGIIAAGWPCQPFSNAGRRKGWSDDRAIWPAIRDALRVLRPRLFLGENVPAHLARGWGRVVRELAAVGYVGSWMCLRASDIGAAHQRDRLFVAAYPADADCGTVGRNLSPSEHATIRPSLETIAFLPTPRASDGAKGGPNQRGSSGDLGLAAAVQPGRWGRYEAAIIRWEGILGRPAPDPTELGMRGAPRLSPRFVEWLMGLPDGHATDVLARSAALRVLGNGVVPSQGAAAFRALAQVTS